MRKTGKERVRTLREEIAEICRSFWQDERGEFVGTIGWMAVVSVALVLAHGLIKGWLPTFIQSIFSRMETLI